MIKDIAMDGKDYYVEYNYNEDGTLRINSINRIMNKGKKGYAIVEYEE